MGFCRTNLFKRLESSGEAFLQSVERHVLRNFVFLHALEQQKTVPIGAQDAEMLDARIFDEDADATEITENIFDDADYPIAAPGEVPWTFSVRREKALVHSG